MSLALATTTTGLVAGLFYAYSCSVMLALRQVGDRTFIDVMQRINTAILNGWFALGFGGALLSTALAAGLHLGDDRPVLVRILSALALYVAMVFVTRAFNIRLNNELAEAGPADRIARPDAVRRSFEGPWVRWNIVRTLLSTGALICLVYALLLY
ncbi:anthrone oxygenase family protein [Nocardiopsis salina]|uniref:anthrone oxygenase family protein n=1 Tax=Nocardiopsis salina TaxID=245836 RepID=UPI001EF9EA4B|nr:anthrone oxygenase family protein [Nocardiopsis salina]